MKNWVKKHCRFAQFDDDGGDFNSPENPEDFNAWEDEQVARDNEGGEISGQEETDNISLGAGLSKYVAGGLAIQKAANFLSDGQAISPDMAVAAIQELKNLLASDSGPRVHHLPPEAAGEITSLIEDLQQKFVGPDNDERARDAQISDQMQEQEMYPDEPAMGASMNKSVKTAWVMDNCNFASEMIIQEAADAIRFAFAEAYKAIKTAQAAPQPAAGAGAPQPQVGQDKLVSWAVEMVQETPAWNVLKQRVAQWSKTWGAPKTPFDIEKLWNDPRIAPVQQAIQEVSKTYGQNMQGFAAAVEKKLKEDLGLSLKRPSAFAPGMKPTPPAAAPGTPGQTMP